MVAEPVVLVTDDDDEEPVAAAKVSKAAAAPDDEDKPRVTIKAGQKGPLKKAKVELVGEWEGTWLTVHINPKRRVFREMNSGDERRSDTALAEAILAHNLTDEDGKALPSPLTYDALGELPHDLYLAVGRAAGEALNKAGELTKS